MSVKKILGGLAVAFLLSSGSPQDGTLQANLNCVEEKTDSGLSTQSAKDICVSLHARLITSAVNVTGRGNFNRFRSANSTRFAAIVQNKTPDNLENSFVLTGLEVQITHAESDYPIVAEDRTVWIEPG